MSSYQMMNQLYQILCHQDNNLTELRKKPSLLCISSFRWIEFLKMFVWTTLFSLNLFSCNFWLFVFGLMCIRLIEDTKESNDISHKLQMHKSLIKISGLYAVPCLIAALLQVSMKSMKSRVLTFGPYNQHFLAAAYIYLTVKSCNQKIGTMTGFPLSARVLEDLVRGCLLRCIQEVHSGVFQLSKYNKHFPFLWQRDFYDSYIITMLTNISMSDRPNYIKIVSILFL